MNTLRKIKLHLGLMNFSYSINRWLLTKNITDFVEDSPFWLNHGPKSPTKEWPYLWKCTKLVYLEITLFGYRDYLIKEAPILLAVYSEKD